MNTVVTSEPRITTISVTADSIATQLADGRTVSVPLAWSWRLSEATEAQRSNFEIIGAGEGVHWPDVDEDISAREECFREFQHGRQCSPQLRPADSF